MRSGGLCINFFPKTFCNIIRIIGSNIFLFSPRFLLDDIRVWNLKLVLKLFSLLSTLAYLVDPLNLVRILVLSNIFDLMRQLHLYLRENHHLRYWNFHHHVKHNFLYFSACPFYLVLEFRSFWFCWVILSHKGVFQSNSRQLWKRKEIVKDNKTKIAVSFFYQLKNNSFTWNKFGFLFPTIADVEFIEITSLQSTSILHFKTPFNLLILHVMPRILLSLYLTMF